MNLVPFIEPDINNPPKCKTCNDYGGLFNNDPDDPLVDGQPYMISCPDCNGLIDHVDRI